MIENFVKILLVDDNPSNLYYLARNFENDGFFIRLAKSYKEAQYYIKEELFDFIITRDVIQNESVEGFIKNATRVHPRPHMIIMCPNQEPYLKYDWFSAPFIDFAMIPIRYQDILSLIKSHYSEQKSPFASIQLEDYPVRFVVIRSDKMRQLFESIKKFAPSRTTILIQGESGTGKEVIARLIHHYSNRKNKPFVAVNCSAIPENLLESELFGYERGAFTGALKAHKGLFETADGGTIFLDEIGEMSTHMQSKLLRVLELKEFYRVGGNKPIKADVRIIAATNQNLENLIHNGYFREDLFYRLKVIQFNIPPLRERSEDIPFLARFFLHQFVKEYQLPPKEISRRALDILSRYHWPGNVRELKNTLERLSLSVEGDLITADDVKELLEMKEGRDSSSITIKIGTPMEEIEKEVLKATLNYCKQNRTRTAKILGIGLRTLQRKIKKYHL
jgi:DNA-binding NtrC family response regulator